MTHDPDQHASLGAMYSDYFLDYARYVDPGDTDGLRAAVLAAWEDPPNDALRGHIRTNLSWEQSAASLVKAYEKHLDRV